MQVWGKWTMRVGKEVAPLVRADNQESKDQNSNICSATNPVYDFAKSLQLDTSSSVQWGHCLPVSQEHCQPSFVNAWNKL